MSRSTPPVRQVRKPRGAIAIILVVILCRTLLFLGVLALAAAMVSRGYEMAGVGGFLAVVVTAAAAASARLTAGALAAPVVR